MRKVHEENFKIEQKVFVCRIHFHIYSEENVVLNYLGAHVHKMCLWLTSNYYHLFITLRLLFLDVAQN